MEQVKGLLFDIGGVLYNGSHLIEGATEAISTLRRHYPMRFLTNTTRRTPDTILHKMRKMGFEVEASQLFTALNAARAFLEEQGATALSVMTDEAEAYFEPFRAERPDFVVVGDAHTNFDYPHLNKAFRALIDGAELIAAAKNRYFQDEDGVRSMDAGGFVAALEFAAQQEARIIGKPSRTFFHLAVASMDLKPHEVMMIGDDIESDIKGAQDAGLRAVLVRTGKFTPDDLKKGITPDAVIDSVRELPKLLLPLHF